MKIAYYVSGHGFGHATRTLPSVRELSGISEQIWLCCPHALFLFPPDTFNGQVKHRQITSSLDGVVQKDAITLDVDATRSMIFGYMNEYESFLAGEKAWLKHQNIDVVLSDAAFVPLMAASSIGIPAIVVTNFVWDSIYDSLLAHDFETQEWRVKVSECYRMASWFRMPGWIESPSFKGVAVVNQPVNTERFVIDIPPVVRSPSKDYTRDHVLSTLERVHSKAWTGITAETLRNRKILLVAFGGHKLIDYTSTASLVPSTEHWAVLIAGVPDKPRIISTQPLILTLDSKHPSISFPDLTAASEVVLTKLGYGTCGECIAAQTPLVYVRREGFVEEEGLLRLMNDDRYGKGLVLELAKHEFQAGNWRRVIEQASLMKRPATCTSLNGKQVIAALVKSIQETLRK